ncbi:MAG: response regulator transcription factor [Muribaculaceae bacterium]|nr:response regulator transcription factor [Muribaculaceae bacterium]
MMQVEAYVIMDDSIRAIALKYLLNEYFGVKAVVASRLESELIADKSASIIYVVSPDVVVFNHDFFVTKRQRTIVVAATPNDDSMAITPDMDEEAIVNVLNRAIESLCNEENKTQQASLTQREIDVLRLIALGHINKEIADMLSISFNTVLTHRKNISAKLGIKSASGLGFYAIMNGYISEEDIRSLKTE